MCYSLYVTNHSNHNVIQVDFQARTYRVVSGSTLELAQAYEMTDSDRRRAQVANSMADILLADDSVSAADAYLQASANIDHGTEAEHVR